MSSTRTTPSGSLWTVRDAREFLEDWRQNANASKARAHLAAALDENDRLAMALERIARGAESNPPHEIAAIAWEALADE